MGVVESPCCLWMDQFDVVNGVVLEGTLEIQTAGETPGRCGIYIEETTGQGTAVMVGTDGQSQLGVLKLEGAKSFEPDDFVRRGSRLVANILFAVDSPVHAGVLLG